MDKNIQFVVEGGDSKIKNSLNLNALLKDMPTDFTDKSQSPGPNGKLFSLKPFFESELINLGFQIQSCTYIPQELRVDFLTLIYYK